MEAMYISSLIEPLLFSSSWLIVLAPTLTNGSFTPRRWHPVVPVVFLRFGCGFCCCVFCCCVRLNEGLEAMDMLKFGRVGEVGEVSEVSKMWTASFTPVS